MNHRREPERGSGGRPGGDTEHHGSSRDVGRGSAEARQAGDRAFRPPPSGPQWPGREVSDAERHGVPATDTEARTPLGVGTSTSRRGEKITHREEDLGRRPRGKSAPEHDTGLEPPVPIHADSPHIPTGDQAG